jgi:hypothetical protein
MNLPESTGGYTDVIDTIKQQGIEFELCYIWFKNDLPLSILKQVKK